jgi:hypothetical protein
MSYEPQVNDYVLWTEYVEGWVYFRSDEYITIEMGVKPKDDENYEACSIHRNDRLLVLCYRQQWRELTCVGRRADKYSPTML